MANGPPILAPILHGPSDASHDSHYTVPSIRWNELQYDTWYADRVFFAVIKTVSVSNGMVLTVEDPTGVAGIIWSLIAFPFRGGEISASEGTIVAVRAPLFKMSPSGHEAICVYHCTDLIRVPKYHSSARALFPSQQTPTAADLLRAGEIAFQAGRLMDALDHYSEYIDRACLSGEANRGSSAELDNVILQRVVTYFLLDNHKTALHEARKIVMKNSKCHRALMLGSLSALHHREFEVAHDFARRLTAIGPLNEDYRKHLDKVTRTVRLANGQIDLESISLSITEDNLIADVPTFIGNIELRPRSSLSSLATRGMFASGNIAQGELLTCEKPIAFAHNPTLSSFNDGLIGLEGGGNLTDRKYMSLLQQLASNAARDQSLYSTTNRLFAGDNSHTELNSSNPFSFNPYRVMRVINFNHHSTTRAKESEFYDLFDPTMRADMALFAAQSDRIPGLWKMGSFFNHSCLPNATYTFMGGLMVVQAIRAIAKDEEITLSYIRKIEGYEERTTSLRKREFQCFCPLCQAEATMHEDANEQRQRMPEIETAMWNYTVFQRFPDHVNAIRRYQETTRLCMKAYSSEAFNNIARLPMVSILFYMGHIFLGNIDNWSAADYATKLKAVECFVACIELGLGLRLIKDVESPYCEIAFFKHSQVSAHGVLAFVALAELAFTSTGEQYMRGRAACLLLCAKQLYKLIYGESASFDLHHLRYRCREVLSDFSMPSPSPNWENIKAETVARGASIPAFLQ